MRIFGFFMTSGIAGFVHQAIQMPSPGKKHLFVHLDRWFEHFNQVYCMMEYLELGVIWVLSGRCASLRKPTYSASHVKFFRPWQRCIIWGYTHRDIKPSVCHRDFARHLIANL